MKQKLLGNALCGKLFVVSAPSGTGKTTLVERLCKEFPCVTRSISCTTREPREGEVDGVDYRFVTQEAFLDAQKRGDFLESARVFADLYGTLKRDVVQAQESGKHVVLVIDTQGAFSVKQSLPAITIFIAPPSMEELKRRLKERNTDKVHTIEERLSWAKREMERKGVYDYFVINDDLEIAYKVLKSIFIAEEHRRSDATA